MTRVALQRARWLLAEVALESTSREQFRHSALAVLCRAVGMDAGALGHSATGREMYVETFGLHEARLQRSNLEFMNEITFEEMRSATTAGRTVSHESIFSDSRRDQLRLYREYLACQGFFGFCAKMWLTRRGCFWATTLREGRAASYRERDLIHLDGLMPIVAVGELLHCQGLQQGECSEGQRDWARQRGISTAEWPVVELAVRGLTNANIATILGRSPTTVRNQLSSAFSKLNVARRTELAFVLGRARATVPAPANGKPTSMERIVAFRERAGSARHAPEQGL